MTKYFLLSFFFITLTLIDLYSSSGGITGLTKKDGGIGCVCHGNHEPVPKVSVFFRGPDSVAVGQTVNYRIYLSHGPAVKGGFDAASFADSSSLNPSILDTSVRRQQGELTHRYPKPFVNDTVFWTFRYTAPSIPLYDTLYAVANSTNFNGQADTLDEWNFSENFPVRVYIPIGIINNQQTAGTFYLGQNYPNPFNSKSNIKYQISKTGLVKLTIFDIEGKLITALVNERQVPGEYEVSFSGNDLPSGVYFYQLSITNYQLSIDYKTTKKMVLIR